MDHHARVRPGAPRAGSAQPAVCGRRADQRQRLNRGSRSRRQARDRRRTADVLADRAGQGTGARLVVQFASPQNIDRVGILSGEPGADYRAQARPQTIELIADGGRPVRLSFDDTPSFQNRAVSLRHVTTITIVISDAYPGQQGQAVALREIEFFTRV